MGAGFEKREKSAWTRGQRIIGRKKQKERINKNFPVIRSFTDGSPAKRGRYTRLNYSFGTGLKFIILPKPLLRRKILNAVVAVIHHVNRGARAVDGRPRGA